jgi:hypothetical protein
MSLSGVYGPSSTYAQEFQTLASAIRSGDILQAQQALTSLQANSQAPQATSGSSGQTTQSGSGFGVQIKTDFSNLSSAVQSGDITGAQNALASLQQDFSQNAGDGSQTSQTHHRYHHHSGGNETSSEASSGTSTATGQTSSNDSTNGILAWVNALYTDNQTTSSS